MHMNSIYFAFIFTSPVVYLAVSVNASRELPIRR